jgi:hypothetical protein
MAWPNVYRAVISRPIRITRAIPGQVLPTVIDTFNAVFRGRPDAGLAMRVAVKVPELNKLVAALSSPVGVADASPVLVFGGIGDTLEAVGIVRPAAATEALSRAGDFLSVRAP